MRRLLLPLFLMTILILTACSTTSSPDPTLDKPFDTAQDEPAPASTEFPQSDAGDLTRSDGQGAVTVTVTPLNLEASASTVEFDIVMDTHSVDLSMDLATLSTLTTDTGITVQAALWDAPRGGHHVEGTLVFPAVQDGKSILEGADKLTLTITNVDTPARIFEWDLE